MTRRLKYVMGIIIMSVLCTTVAVAGTHAIQATLQTTFLVTNLNNSGPGSLRQAILNANATPGEDLITITVLGQLDLQSALPTITEAVTIYVPNAGTIFRPFKIDGQNLYRGLTITSVPVTITGLTVQNAVAFGTLSGGGINSGGNLTLNSVTVLNRCDCGERQFLSGKQRQCQWWRDLRRGCADRKREHQPKQPMPHVV